VRDFLGGSKLGRAPNLIYFNEVDEGNHVAAWQEPEPGIFIKELRAAFRTLR
jgi:hypothetical protein